MSEMPVTGSCSTAGDRMPCQCLSNGQSASSKPIRMVADDEHGIDATQLGDAARPRRAAAARSAHASVATMTASPVERLAVVERHAPRAVVRRARSPSPRHPCGCALGRPRRPCGR